MRLRLLLLEDGRLGVNFQAVRDQRALEAAEFALPKRHSPGQFISADNGRTVLSRIAGTEDQALAGDRIGCPVGSDADLKPLAWVFVAVRLVAANPNRIGAFLEPSISVEATLKMSQPISLHIALGVPSSSISVMVRCLGLISSARMVVFPLLLHHLLAHQRRFRLQQDLVNIH